MLLHLWRTVDPLARQDRRRSTPRPRHARRRHQCARAAEARRMADAPSERSPPRSCQSPPMASAGGADRAAEIEGKNLSVRIAAELQRHQRQQHGLAGAGRSDHQRMADIADVEREAERRRALGLGRRTAAARLKCSSLASARPRLLTTGSCARDSASRPAAAERWRRHGRAGLPSQASTALTLSDHAGEVTALDHLLDQTQLFVGDARDHRPRPSQWR